MKHSLLGLSLLATCASSAYAQTPAAPATAPTATPAKPAAPKPLVLPEAPKGTGRLSGTVLDGATKKPVEFATVALLPATGDTPIDGTVADEKGRFSLRGLAPGAYRLQLSFLGYAALTRDVTVTSGPTDLGALGLTASAQQLGDVTVTGEKETIEVKPDRIVYNADRDLTNKGGMAADVLRKVPLLNVDLDGNVQLRGSSNIRVLINNKPSSILAGSVADALKQLPADQIASVEVITTPGAKYDGEGTAGIVNIILKKNNLQGVNGSVNAAAGNRSSNAGGSLNVRRGKVGVSTNLSSYLYYSPSASTSERTNFNGSPANVISQLSQNGSGDNLGGGAYGRMSLDYDPAKNHSLTFGFSGSLNRNNNESEQTNNFLNVTGPTPSRLFTRATEYKFNSSSYDVNGTYTRTFEGQPRREWSLLAQHSRNRNLQPYALNQYENQFTATGLPNYRESSDNLSRNLETTLQTDYTHPIGDKRSVEVGGKAILRRVLSDYQIQTATGPDAPFVVDRQRSNVFDYDQNVVAAYGTYGFPLGKKLNSRLGTRLERTDIVGRFQQNDITRFTSGYTSLLPNASISYTRKPGNTLRLAYSRRIQRPNIYYLNPYENRVDRFNVSKGNPELEPEFTDSYELNYSTFVKGSVLNFSLFTRQTDNAIEAVRTLRGDTTTVTSYANVARNRTYGASVFGSFKPTSKWEISGSTSFNYVVLRSGALNTTNEGLMYNFNLNSTYKFTKTLSAQFYGGINSSRVQLQGRAAAWNYYSLGVKKTILKEKGDLTLNADNFITARRDLNSTINTPLFDLEQHNYIALRGIRLAFGYRFGKIEVAPPKQRRSIRNDDTKAGESQGGQQ